MEIEQLTHPVFASLDHPPCCAERVLIEVAISWLPSLRSREAQGVSRPFVNAATNPNPTPTSRQLRIVYTPSFN
jgi:hypothetical protein